MNTQSAGSGDDAISPTLPAIHRPVLLDEVIAALQPHPGGRYLDGTFGGGGHTRAILHESAPDGIVLAIDADDEAIRRGRNLELGDRLRLVQGNFSQLAEIATRESLAPLDGILLDLGLSSFQLDTAGRGFAFRLAGPLDMRFDRTAGQTAADLVRTLPVEELTQILWRFGEESRGRQIARAIGRARERAPIETTAQLAQIVSDAVGGRRGSDTHPATRTFQALRIATNGELEALEQALAGAAAVLRPGGRLAVISFHSLEDRMVKAFVRHESAICICPPELPICVCDHLPRFRAVGKAIKPSAAELSGNPRGRSAVLRIAERLSDEEAALATRGKGNR